MNAYTTTNIDLATANGSEPIVAPYSKDFMSGIDNFRNVVMPRYCPTCEDRRKVRLSGYHYFDDEELTTPDELEMPDFTSGGAGSGSSTSNCTWWQKISGQCKDADLGYNVTGKMKRCKEKYPKDYDAYKKCLSENKVTGQGVLDTINNIFGTLGGIFGQQSAANAGNYNNDIPPSDDEPTGLSTGAKIGIGIAVAGVLGIIVYQIVKKPKK